MATLKERIKELCKKNGISMRKAEKDLGFAQGYDVFAPFFGVFYCSGCGLVRRQEMG